MLRRELKLFGKAVRTTCERLRISQEELAYRSGLHRTYVGGIERGERNLGLVNIARIAKALGVKPSRLVASLDRPEAG
jgi:transcriptional regulator with XRE-family HTH domain